MQGNKFEEDSVAKLLKEEVNKSCSNASCVPKVKKNTIAYVLSTLGVDGTVKVDIYGVRRSIDRRHVGRRRH